MTPGNFPAPLLQQQTWTNTDDGIMALDCPA